jgi:DNA replication protein DnaC
MIVTTNRSIASGGEIFSDQMMAAAILDRFLYRATLLAINGDSYRMRAHRERLAQLRAGIGASPPAPTEPAR